MKNPNESTAVGIYRKDGTVFLSRRAKSKKFPDIWQFPGGKVDNGETPLEGAARELKEEAGLSVEHKRLKFINGFDDGTGYVCYIYVLELRDNETPIHTEPEAMSDWHAMYIEEATQFDSMPGVKPILDYLINHR
jgi:mutator protein MutT